MNNYCGDSENIEPKTKRTPTKQSRASSRTVTPIKNDKKHEKAADNCVNETNNDNKDLALSSPEKRRKLDEQLGFGNTIASPSSPKFEEMKKQRKSLGRRVSFAALRMSGI